MGGNRGRTEHGTSAGITVTTDGLQERVPISSFRVKQREGKKKQTERPNKERTWGKMKHNVLQRRDQISGKESSGNNENA